MSTQAADIIPDNWRHSSGVASAAARTEHSGADKRHQAGEIYRDSLAS